MAPVSSTAMGRSGSGIPTQSDSECQQEDIKQDNHKTACPKATWRHVFAFTERHHISALVLAVVAAAYAAGVKISNAVFLGKFLDIDTSLGNGTMTMESATDNIAFLCIIFTVLGATAWVFNWAFMTAWIVFGELTAKSARETLFANLLYREMAWFDSQEEGVSSALSSIQM